MADLTATKVGLSIFLLVFISTTIFFLEELVPEDLKETDDKGVVSEVKEVKYELPFLDKPEIVKTSTHFIILVVLGGSLGGAIHGLAKLADNILKGKLRQNHALWYITRPFLGTALAITVYLAIRGGIVTTVGVDALNPSGITAISIIVGLSSNTVTLKLKEVLETLFPTAQKKKELLESLHQKLADKTMTKEEYDEIKKRLDEE